MFREFPLWVSPSTTAGARLPYSLYLPTPLNISWRVTQGGRGVRWLMQFREHLCHKDQSNWISGGMLTSYNLALVNLFFIYCSNHGTCGNWQVDRIPEPPCHLALSENRQYRAQDETIDGRFSMFFLFPCCTGPSNHSEWWINSQFLHLCLFFRFAI